MYIGFARIYVNDQQRAKAFYTEKLGWEVRNDVPMDGDTRWLSVAPPGAQTGLVLAKNFDDWTPEKVGGHCGIAIELDDVFKTAERWKAAGVEFTREPDVAFFGAHAMFKDSEGNEILMHGPAPEGAKQ